MSVLAAPQPVAGSDGLIHFVYELQVTNAAGFAVRIESVEVLDGVKEEHVLALFSEKEVAKNLQGLIKKSPIDVLESGQVGIIFLHFTMKKLEVGLKSLVHRLTISGKLPPGLTHFMGLSPSENRIEQIGGFSEIDLSFPSVIAPPLEGKGWIAADGCCTAKRHIRAIMPINGQLYVAQRFAIDWEFLNEENRLFEGDPSDVKSYFAYGRKVLAVADSTVVRAVDQFKDQIPGKLPSDITLKEVDGNHIVLDLGDGRFAYYAHLQPGSINARNVKVGDTVRRGQVLGLVGNSGHSSAPHLHFHLMSSPATLGSNGLPYVIEEFELVGRGRSTEEFNDAELSGRPLVIQQVDLSGTHLNVLPLDLSLVGFPSK